jgi:PPOX class probable F420-dependent enzyme
VLVSLELASGLALVERRLAEDRHLAVLITTRPDRDEPQVAVVNAAVIDHPITGERLVALVARRGAKLANLRRHPRATVVARAGWEWAAVTGAVELSGPDDVNPAFGEVAQRALLRQIFVAAGGHHPDFDVYDRVMLDERRCAVLIHPTRVWSNPTGSEHREPEDAQ